MNFEKIAATLARVITDYLKDTCPMDSREPDVDERRVFLKQLMGVGGVLPLARHIAVGAVTVEVATAVPALADTAPTPPVTPPNTAPASPVMGYLSFSPEEAAFVETMVNIMCPADAFSPNGVDCGLNIYIDRQLAGEFGRGAKMYNHGPWHKGKPQHGFQLPLTPEQHFKAGLAAANHVCIAKFGKPFDQISAADADAFLNDLGAGKIVDTRIPMGPWFNELVYPLFTQACFADPVYGGNYDKVFWKMIGYPGLPATNATNMVQYRGKRVPNAATPKSIVDFS